jgi:hypothetical protein
LRVSRKRQGDSLVIGKGGVREVKEVMEKLDCYGDTF